MLSDFGRGRAPAVVLRQDQQVGEADATISPGHVQGAETCFQEVKEIYTRLCVPLIGDGAHLLAGEVYMKLWRQYGRGRGIQVEILESRLILTAAPSAPVANAGATAFSGAQSIRSGVTVTGGISSGTSHIYSFAAAAGGGIEASVGVTSSFGQPQLDLYDPSGALVTAPVAGTNGTTLRAAAKVSGTYYLVVKDYTGSDDWTYDLEARYTPLPSGGTSGGTISGMLFEDVNSDGVEEAGEPPLPSWTVFLDTNKNGRLDRGELTTTSDSSGKFKFTSLPFGSYAVAEVVQSGFKQTAPAKNTSVVTVSPAHPTTTVLIGNARIVAPLAWGRHVSAAFRVKVRSIATTLGTDPSFLMAAMAFESSETFSASIQNRLSGAVGLIQFTAATAKLLGTTIAALKAMTPERQLDLVAKYFAPDRGRLKNLGDVYMAILWPAAIGKRDDYVLFRKGSIYYSQNSGLDLNHDGAVTRLEAATPVIAKLQKGMRPANFG